MMTRTQTLEYLLEHYEVDSFGHKQFNRLLKNLIDEPHKPWCRKKLAGLLPNYGSECTCDEGL